MKITKTTFFLGCLTGGIGAAFVPLLIPSTQAETKLLPFQGRLTDAAGAAIPDGAKVVEFKLYDAPTGGNVKWAGEVHKLSINGGLVNTMLGSKASLGSVDFSTPCYLQITVDANADSQITAADPPLLPRQSVVPSIFAMESLNSRDAQMLQGSNWSSIISNGDPNTGTISGTRLTGASITQAQMAIGSVGISHLVDGAVTSPKLADGAVEARNLSPSVTQMGVPVGTILSYGGPNPPPGYLLCNGGVYARTGQYAALFDAIGVSFGSTGPTTFRVPETRGLFLRGWISDAPIADKTNFDPGIDQRRRWFHPDLPSGYDSFTGIGSFQVDALQGHGHRLSAKSWGVAANHVNDNWMVWNNAPVATAKSDDASVTVPLGDGVNGAPRISAETRPRNVSVNYIIKY
jgi:hypothetical protein